MGYDKTVSYPLLYLETESTYPPRCLGIMEQNTQHSHHGLGFGSSAFHLSISNNYPELVSSDGTLRVPMASLDTHGLIKAKNLAHNQYVQAMLHDADNLDVHRATLNFLCKAVEKAGNPVNRPHTPHGRTAPNRKALLSTSSNEVVFGAKKRSQTNRKRITPVRKSAA